MEQIFQFDSRPEPYLADAAVLCCFDQRIRLAVNEFLLSQRVLRPDMIVVAGGARTLASPRNDFERDFILEQVRMSIRLHQTKQIFLMSHSDCATYGGLAAFGGDREREAIHHQQELHRAAELIKSSFPELKVKCFFVTFDGVHAAFASKKKEEEARAGTAGRGRERRDPSTPHLLRTARS
jgi:carbonic anhydrase